MPHTLIVLVVHRAHKLAVSSQVSQQCLAADAMLPYSKHLLHVCCRSTNCRYRQLSRANEHLAGQLKEALEALFEVQTAVQATPVHKRREQTHLMGRLHDAEQVGLG